MRLVKDSILVLGIRVCGLIFQLVVFALIARTHSLSEIGVFAFVNAIWIITRTLGPLGYDQAAMRFIPGYLTNKRPDWVAQYIELSRHKVQKHMITWGGVGVTIGVVLFIIGGEYATYGILVMILALGIPAYALIGLDVCIARSLGKVAQAQIPESLYLQIFLALGVGATVLAGVVSVEYTLAIQLGSAWLVLLVYRRLLVSRLQHDLCVNDGTELDKRPIYKMASSTMKGMAATALAARLPVILLAGVVASELVGLFEGASRLGLLASVPVWAVGVVVSPMIARAAANSDTHTIRRLYSVAGVFQTIPALAMLIFLVFYGDIILGMLFGDSFRLAHSVVVIIAFAVLVNSAGSIASNYLLMTGGEAVVQTYSMWALLIVIFGVPAGVYLGGLEGAAWALVLRSLVRDIGLTIVVAKTRNLMPGLLLASQIKWMLREVFSRCTFSYSKNR